MKKNLAKKIVLGLLTGAVLMSSSVAWAEGFTIGPAVILQNDGGDNNSASDSGIAIGHRSWAQGEYSIAIGNNTAQGTYTMAEGGKSIAIGASAEATGINSVALGYGSVAGDPDVVSVGSGTGNGQTRRIVNVTAGVLNTDVATVGQVKDKYGEGKTFLASIGSELIKGKNLTDAVVALDGAVVELDKAVKNITTPDLSSYAKTDDVAVTYATKTELDSKANVADVYTKEDANKTFVMINKDESNAPNSGFNVVNTNDITKVSVTHVDGNNPVVISSDEGITVGKNSARMDGYGFYVWDSNANGHVKGDAIVSITDDGKLKAAGGKFEVGTKGEIKAANGSFKVDADGNVTAEKVTAKEVVAKNLYTKDDIDGMLGGSNASVAGLSQRLDKTNAKINKVGAGAAALAALHPLEYDPDDKLTFSAGMGNYAGENAAALGAFYRPNEKFMVSLGGTMGNGENMVNIGLSIGLDKPNGYAKLSKRELIQKVNAMEAKYEAVEAENEAMKAEMAEMKAMLQAILAKK